ncbi:MAG: HlyD family efflux transporter periplasmic adaptor subunit [Oligoflexia bacterium]|nr:HlyD family efflux transporter periplasmic adaptor subunit [Oligoflexia bacterium]
MKHYVDKIMEWMKNCVLFLILLMSVLAFSCHKQSDKDSAVTDGDNTTFVVKRGDVVQFTEWEGDVRYSERKEIITEREIKIKEVLVNNFDTVVKGQKIITLDTDLEVKEYHLQLEKANIDKMELDSFAIKHSQIEKDVHVKKMLADKGIIPYKEYESILNDYRNSVTELKRRQMNLQKGQDDLAEAKLKAETKDIVASSGGVISNLIIKKSGVMQVGIGQGIGVISDPSKLAFEIFVEDTFIKKLTLGMDAIINLDAVPKPMPAKINFISTHSDSDPQEWEGGGSQMWGGDQALVKKYIVRFTFAADTNMLKEFYRGSVKIVFNQKNQILVLPLSAVKSLEGANYVQVVVTGSESNKKPILKKVVLGLQNETETEVISGVNEGDVVLATWKN